MNIIKFTKDEYDLLKEVFNLAMGHAGKALANLLNAFIELKVPDIKLVKAEKVIETIFEHSVFEENENIITFQQSFSNPHLNGITIVVFDDKTRHNISDILGLKDKMDAMGQLDFMNELSNILVGACINNISEQLFNQSMSFKKPEMIAEGISLREMTYNTFMRTKLKWRYTLFVKISLFLKEKSFKCDLIIFMSEKDTETILKSIQDLMPEDLYE
ncbi:MAG: hypothetical protein GY710_09805 [Desulfobacteraceae bacterium]|nr:hypothetical protein [Desulfobacteraceae bacterium]